MRRPADNALAMYDAGPVLPHYLQREPEHRPTAEYGNLAPRVGEVLELLWPDDPRNVSKRVIEYRVAVQHLDTDGGTATTREYPNCIALNPLAGLADRCVNTYRADGAQGRQGLGKGSKVLLLCLNGETASAVILGGIRDQADATDASLRETYGDHFYVWRFNGCRMIVTADGTFSLDRSGPTDINGDTLDGTPEDSVANLTFNSDGSVTLGARNSRTSAKAEQRFAVNQPARRLELHAGSAVHVGDATENVIRGKSYRTAQRAHHRTVRAVLQVAQGALASIQTSLEATAKLMVIPIVGPVLAASAFQALAVQVKILGTLCQQFNDSLAEFESDDWLSRYFLAQ